MLAEINEFGVLMKPQTLEHIVKTQQIFDQIHYLDHERAALELMNPSIDHEDIEMVDPFISVYYRAIEEILSRYGIRVMDDPERIEFKPRLALLETLVDLDSPDNLDILESVFEAEYEDSFDLLADLVDKMGNMDFEDIREYIEGVDDNLIEELRKRTLNVEEEEADIEETRRIVSAYKDFTEGKIEGPVSDYARLAKQMPLSWDQATIAIFAEYEGDTKPAYVAKELYSLAILCDIPPEERVSKLTIFREEYLPDHPMVDAELLKLGG